MSEIGECLSVLFWSCTSEPETWLYKNEANPAVHGGFEAEAALTE